MITSLHQLSESERDTIGECLRAVVEGPFIPEEEFHTIFGLERHEVASVLKAWPNVDESDEVVRIAINNSLNNLLGYPHGMDDEWPKWIGVSMQELNAIFTKWLGDRPGSYVDRLQ